MGYDPWDAVRIAYSAKISDLGSLHGLQGDHLWVAPCLAGRSGQSVGQMAVR
jgi:hypothetical protein